jgi:predicted nucleic acid-binding protein
MRLLLDTNVFLEVILEQNQAEIAKPFYPGVASTISSSPTTLSTLLD